MTSMVTIKENGILAKHPLEPLSAAEIQAAVKIVKEEKNLSEKVRFQTITLHEPPKEVVLNFTEGSLFQREVFMVLLDNENVTAYEVVVSLNTASVTSFVEVKDVQPGIMSDEFAECEDLVKAHPDFIEALKKRGIDSPELVMVDPWSSGYFGIPENEGKRIVRAV